MDRDTLSLRHLLYFLFFRPCIVCFSVLYDRCLFHYVYDDLLIAKVQSQIPPRLPQHVDWKHNPETVEENQVDPEIQEVVCCQVLTSCQPLRTEGHPT